MEQSLGYSVERVGRAVRDNKRLFLLRCLVSLKETERESLIFSSSVLLVPFLLDMPATNRSSSMPVCLFSTISPWFYLIFPKRKAARLLLRTQSRLVVIQASIKCGLMDLHFDCPFLIDIDLMNRQLLCEKLRVQSPSTETLIFQIQICFEPPMDFFDMVKSMKMSPPSLLCPLTLGQCKLATNISGPR